jgi:hypothetical protein
MNYSIETHKHRLAAWAASRAASTSKLCRFKVSTGIAILEETGFDDSLTIKELPLAQDIDTTHAIWRNRIINAASKHDLNFTHGIAAKLINIYLKVRFVCGGFDNDPRVKALHPPIDEVLLKELASKNIGNAAKEWSRFRNLRWSKYDSQTYESVIKLIKKILPENAPLWTIEKYWQGHQGISIEKGFNLL